MRRAIGIFVLLGLFVLLLGGFHEGLRVVAQGQGTFSERAASTCAACHGG
jgi:cytochrome c553